MNHLDARRRSGVLAAVAAAALLAALTGARDAAAYEFYDDGTSHGCVECHNGFKGGPTNTLHDEHLNKFNIMQCNFCHPHGGASTPVRTVTSGVGGGYGCAGCHGQNYGETSITSGKPKATGYGLRDVHAAAGVMICSSCHYPGSPVTGIPNPPPARLPEYSRPPYYRLHNGSSNLHDPCSSSQENFIGDPDGKGLDNDGNGFRDSPDDPGCPPTAMTTSTTTTTTTTTTTIPVACAPAPTAPCTASGQSKLSVNEKSAGKEKLKAQIQKLVPALAATDFGDPVIGTTNYALCIYDGSNALKGELSIVKGGENCGTDPCWEGVKTTGYKYKDKDLTADGVQKIQLSGGDAGKGKVSVSAKNTSSANNMPVGIAAALNGATHATVQLLDSSGHCYGATLSQVKTADGTVFSATGP